MQKDLPWFNRLYQFYAAFLLMTAVFIQAIGTQADSLVLPNSPYGTDAAEFLLVDRTLDVASRLEYSRSLDLEKKSESKSSGRKIKEDGQKGMSQSQQSAVFAGGCFWCMQFPFDALQGKGVISTTVGYTGGAIKDPDYASVSSGSTGHREALQVAYDPRQISYEELLEVFWQNVDPVDASGQFCDKGLQYTSAIFYENDAQRKSAEASLEKVSQKLAELGKVATKILPVKEFYPAEEYHQEYYKKNPIRYKFYRFNCGRDARLKKIWGETSH